MSNKRTLEEVLKDVPPIRYKTQKEAKIKLAKAYIETMKRIGVKSFEYDQNLKSFFYSYSSGSNRLYDDTARRFTLVDCLKSLHRLSTYLIEDEVLREDQRFREQTLQQLKFTLLNTDIEL